MINLPSLSPSDFCWATGIEDTFIAHVRPGHRALDEYELIQHYAAWRRDLDLVADLGVKALRWGIPWYRVQPAPDCWDWSWTDEVLEYMVIDKGITPILDLMHYGTPLWLHNSFINHRYPAYVAEYARAVAERYQSLVSVYTPLNEPMINTDLCGRRGEWPPYLSGDDGYVKVLLALAKGIVLTTQAITAEQPNALTVQVEAQWHNWTKDAALTARVAENNAKQYLCFDLVTGRVDSHYPLRDFLLEHGVTQAELDWFSLNAVCFDAFGLNFYPWSYGEVATTRTGRLHRVPQHVSGAAIADVIQAAYTRYGLPIIVTETSAKANVMGRTQWMDETITAVRELRVAGIPVVGYTWFPLFTMIDWDYRTGRKPLESYLLHLGLYDCVFDAQGDLCRDGTPLVERYQDHISVVMPPVSTSTSAIPYPQEVSNVQLSLTDLLSFTFNI